MTTPKLKEDGHTRAHRLDLGKPHIMWCPFLGKWLLALYWSTKRPDRRKASYFCKAQQSRWTPRDKS